MTDITCTLKFHRTGSLRQAFTLKYPTLPPSLGTSLAVFYSCGPRRGSYNLIFSGRKEVRRDGTIKVTKNGGGSEVKWDSGARFNRPNWRWGICNHRAAAASKLTFYDDDKDEKSREIDSRKIFSLEHTIKGYLYWRKNSLLNSISLFFSSSLSS